MTEIKVGVIIIRGELKEGHIQIEVRAGDHMIDSEEATANNIEGEVRVILEIIDQNIQGAEVENSEIK